MHSCFPINETYYVEEQLADNEDVLRNLSQYKVQWTHIDTIELEEALSKYGDDPEYNLITLAPFVYNEDNVARCKMKLRI